MSGSSTKLEPLSYIAGSLPSKNLIWFGYGPHLNALEISVNGRRLLPTEYTISEDGIITLLTFSDDACECEQCR